MAEGGDYRELPRGEYTTIMANHGIGNSYDGVDTSIRNEPSEDDGQVVRNDAYVQECHQVEDTSTGYGGGEEVPNMPREQRVEMQMKANEAEMERVPPFDIEQMQRFVDDLKRERQASERERDKCQEVIRDIDKKFLYMYNVVTATLDLYTKTNNHQTEKVTELLELCSELQKMTYSRNEDTDALKQKAKILEDGQRAQQNAQQAMKAELDQLKKEMRSQQIVNGQLRQKLNQPAAVRPDEIQAMRHSIEDLRFTVSRLARDLQRPEPAAPAPHPPVNISINSPINNYVSPCTNAEASAARSAVGAAPRQNVGEPVGASGNHDVTGRQWGNPEPVPGPTTVPPPHYQLEADQSKQGYFGTLPSYSSLNRQPVFSTKPSPFLSMADLKKPPEDHGDSGASTMPPCSGI